MNALITKNVPCGNCVACCQKDLIILKPHLGDIVDNYDTEFDGNNFVLKHKKNGDCIYLSRLKGCTIHDRRPIVCRGLDCRFVFQFNATELEYYQAQGFLRKKMVKAAKALRKKHGMPNDT